MAKPQSNNTLRGDGTIVTTPSGIVTVRNAGSSESGRGLTGLATVQGMRSEWGGYGNVVEASRLQYAMSACKAWGRVNYSAGVPSLADSYNVTSITDNGVGQLTVTLDHAMDGANYVVAVSPKGDRINACVAPATMSTTAFTLYCYTNNTNALYDPESLLFAIFGDKL